MGKFSFSIKTETQKENATTAYESEILILKMAKTAKTVDPNAPSSRGWTDREMFSRWSVRFPSLRSAWSVSARNIVVFLVYCYSFSNIAVIVTHNKSGRYEKCRAKRHAQEHHVRVWKVETTRKSGGTFFHDLAVWGPGCGSITKCQLVNSSFAYCLGKTWAENKTLKLGFRIWIELKAIWFSLNLLYVTNGYRSFRKKSFRYKSFRSRSKSTRAD